MMAMPSGKNNWRRDDDPFRDAYFRKNLNAAIPEDDARLS